MDISGFLADLVRPVIEMLPEGSPLPIPDMSGIGNALGAFDSLVPIGPVLFVGLGLLSFLGVFLLVRAVLVVWNLVYP